jgi:6,7-dimethyl-8-ribityllumazine synthase
MSGMNIVEGVLNAQGKSFGIVISRYNSLVTRELLHGARDCLLRHGAQEKDITVAWVPGAWEIPQILRRLADSKKFQALIVLGCVIRGGTPHFEQVVAMVTRGVGELTMRGNVPVAFGVLTTDNLEQALERAGAKAGNKGWETALAAVEMADLCDRLP